MSRPPSSRAVAWIPALVLAYFMGVPAGARAEPPVLIWGFQQGCERMADLDHAVERELYAMRRNVTLMKAPSGQPLPACSGERCGQALRAACPGASGYVLGGQGQEGKIVRTRLWLYDLATGQVAFADDYCHTCLLSGALPVHVRALLEHPRFGPLPGPTPMYCGGSGARREEAMSRGPVLLSVYGEGKQKAALSAALRGQLEALGRTLLAGENKPYSRDELDRILSGQDGAKALVVLAQKDNITLQLYDQKARVSDAETVNCPECGTEALILKVKEAVSDLLGRCAGAQCAAVAMSGAVQPPVAACEPFPADSCASAGLDALLSPANLVTSGGGIDPKTAKLIKGLTWGAFAASAATGITLFALSGTSLGTYSGPNGVPISHGLDRPAWATLGVAGVLLGVSIPITIIVDRAASRDARNHAGGHAASPIQCPN